jgi:hypothetical protein
MAKYGVYDSVELSVKMDAIRQEPRQQVQLYYVKLEGLFVKGKILDAKWKKRFLAHLKLEIRKLGVVHTYVDMDELLATTIEVEKVLGEIGETHFEPLKEERDEEANEGESSIEWQIHTFNEMLIKKIKGSSGKEIIPSRSLQNSSVCQLSNMVSHGVFACSKLFDRLKCDKCEGGHRIKNCGLKCSYCFGLKHMKKCCWKKNGNGLATSANHLEVLINDEEATLAK